MGDPVAMPGRSDDVVCPTFVYALALLQPCVYTTCWWSESSRGPGPALQADERDREHREDFVFGICCEERNDADESVEV